MDSTVRNFSIKPDRSNDQEIKIYSFENVNAKLSKSNCKLKYILVILIILFISITINYFKLFFMNNDMNDKMKILNQNITELKNLNNKSIIKTENLIY